MAHIIPPEVVHLLSSSLRYTTTLPAPSHEAARIPTVFTIVSGESLPTLIALSTSAGAISVPPPNPPSRFPLPSTQNLNRYSHHNTPRVPVLPSLPPNIQPIYFSQKSRYLAAPFPLPTNPFVPDALSRPRTAPASPNVPPSSFNVQLSFQPSKFQLGAQSAPQFHHVPKDSVGMSVDPNYPVLGNVLLSSCPGKKVRLSGEWPL